MFFWNFINKLLSIKVEVRGKNEFLRKIDSVVTTTLCCYGSSKTFMRPLQKLFCEAIFNRGNLLYKIFPKIMPFSIFEYSKSRCLIQMVNLNQIIMTKSSRFTLPFPNFEISRHVIFEKYCSVSNPARFSSSKSKQQYFTSIISQLCCVLGNFIGKLLYKAWKYLQKIL